MNACRVCRVQFGFTIFHFSVFRFSAVSFCVLIALICSPDVSLAIQAGGEGGAARVKSAEKRADETKSCESKKGTLPGNARKQEDTNRPLIHSFEIRETILLRSGINMMLSHGN